MRRTRIQKPVRIESARDRAERELAETLLASEVDAAIRRAHESRRNRGRR